MWEIAIEEKWERDAGFGPSTGRSIKPFLPAGIKKHGARGEGRGGGSSLMKGRGCSSYCLLRGQNFRSRFHLGC